MKFEEWFPKWTRERGFLPTSMDCTIAEAAWDAGIKEGSLGLSFLCPKCNGAGIVHVVYKSSHGKDAIPEPCPSCGGEE